jgi:hypothetical protein
MTTQNAPTYDSQVLFVRTTRCTRCGALHTTSELFANDPNSRNGRHLFPAPVFVENMPIEKVATTVRLTPICHACADTIQSTTDRESYARWQDTLKRKRLEELQERRLDAKARKPEPTLEDLI